MPSHGNNARSTPSLWGRSVGYLLAWFTIASAAAVAVELCSGGEVAWGGLVTDRSWRGGVTAVLLFLFVQAVDALFVGSACVAVSLAIFHGCVRVRAGRWAVLGVVVISVLLSGLIFWLFIVTWDDHGQIASVGQRVASALPLMAATVGTGLAVAMGEGHWSGASSP